MKKASCVAHSASFSTSFQSTSSTLRNSGTTLTKHYRLTVLEEGTFTLSCKNFYSNSDIENFCFEIRAVFCIVGDCT